LSSSVPEGDFDLLVSDWYYFAHELDSNRCGGVLFELIFDVSAGNVGLAGVDRSN
jgi:hypothetical protein